MLSLLSEFCLKLTQKENPLTAKNAKNLRKGRKEFSGASLLCALCGDLPAGALFDIRIFSEGCSEGGFCALCG